MMKVTTKAPFKVDLLIILQAHSKQTNVQQVKTFSVSLPW